MKYIINKNYKGNYTLRDANGLYYDIEKDGKKWIILSHASFGEPNYFRSTAESLSDAKEILSKNEAIL